MERRCLSGLVAEKEWGIKNGEEIDRINRMLKIKNEVRESSILFPSS
jgi:hypothetical protein